MSKNRPRRVKDCEEIKEPRKKRRMGIKLIENREALHTTFTKRRQGLFKKATELCDNFAAQTAVIAFSSSGNVYVQGDPKFDPLLKRYLADPTTSVAAAYNGVNGGGVVVAAMTNSENRINEALGKGESAWDRVTMNLGLSELDDMETAMKYVKSKVKMRECLQN
ncbi:MADS-box transcription factor 29-like [Henckelia pumila]